MVRNFRKIITKKLRRDKLILKSEGDSMLPIFKSGDKIIYIKTNFKKIRVNDYILEFKKNTFFTHRVIYKTRQYLISKGDNNLQSDGKIFPRQILARVIRIKRMKKIFNPELSYFAQSNNYLDEMVNIINVFKKKNIEFLFLKGLPIHLHYYDRPPMRFFSDCDLLINKFDLEKVNHIFQSMGYKHLDTSFLITQKLLKNIETELIYYKFSHNFPIYIDLHLNINFMMTQIGKLNDLYQQENVNNLSIEFIKQKRYIILNKNRFPILSEENLILYLALHFFHHNYRGFHRLEILNKIVSKVKRKNLVNITSKIKKYSLENFVYTSFYFVNKYFSNSKDKTKFILYMIKPSPQKIKYIHRKLIKLNIFNDETRIESGVNRFRNLFFLSPHPFYKKISTFFNLHINYVIIWIIVKIIKNNFCRFFNRKLINPIS